MMMDTSAWLGAITTSCQPTRFGCCTRTHNSGSECIQHGVVVGGWYVYRAGVRTNQSLQRVVSITTSTIKHKAKQRTDHHGGLAWARARDLQVVANVELALQPFESVGLG